MKLSVYTLNGILSYGLLITAFIFFAATFISLHTQIGINFLPNFFITLTIELILSIVAIFIMQKQLSYKISLPKIKTILKPIVIALATTVLLNISMTIVIKIAGGTIEIPATLSKLNPTQVFIFVFIYASIAEEFLFHGFFMNMLKPLRTIKITIIKRSITFPVILSAFAFSAVHLVLIPTGVSNFFLARILFFTFCLGLLAGYYQEKHDNHFYAILVHMSGNSLAVIASLSHN